MDKQILERACVVFQVLGYGYFLYWCGDLLGATTYYIKANLHNLILAIAVPLITRWVLTGKLRFKPVMSKSEED